MYKTLEWLFPDDPWVAQAVADHRVRVKKPVLPDPNAFLAELADYPPVRWSKYDPDIHPVAKEKWDLIKPMEMGAAIRSLVEAEDFKKAEELALRYAHIATAVRNRICRAYAMHLYHKVRQASGR